MARIVISKVFITTRSLVIVLAAIAAGVIGIVCVIGVDSDGGVRGFVVVHGMAVLKAVLYCIYTFLPVHANQKRFQCERPGEKKAVLRERKDALGTPVNKVDRVEGRSWFQSAGPMTEP